MELGPRAAGAVIRLDAGAVRWFFQKPVGNQDVEVGWANAVDWHVARGSPKSAQADNSADNNVSGSNGSVPVSCSYNKMPSEPEIKGLLQLTPKS